MTTSRPSLLPSTSTRRVVRPPAKSKPRRVTCKCSLAGPSWLYGLVPDLPLVPNLVHEGTTGNTTPCDASLTSLVLVGSKEPVSGPTMRQHPSNTTSSWYVETFDIVIRGRHMLTNVRRRADSSASSPRRTLTTPPEPPRATRSHRPNACVKATRRPSSPTFQRSASV